jgi:hypothetical protein
MRRITATTTTITITTDYKALFTAAADAFGRASRQETPAAGIGTPASKRAATRAVVFTVVSTAARAARGTTESAKVADCVTLGAHAAGFSALGDTRAFRSHAGG